LRIYPYAFLRACLRRLQARGEDFGVYLHPWELDPEHPRVALPFRVAATHYFNLRATERRLRALLRDFAFAPLCQVHAHRLPRAGGSVDVSSAGAAG
ncbi:MAG: DUF3473 domain-containing protein, partial [Thermoanaerobaculia bacterium]